MSTSLSWPQRVDDAHEYLVGRGHIDPIVAVSTPDGRQHAGDPDARCEIGSVTKVFTALLLAELARTGEVGVTDRVADLLPEGTRLARGVASITLEHLACHRSGLPRLPPGVLSKGMSRTAVADPYADITEERLIEALARTRVHGTPGQAPVRYSNLGVGLLGMLLGRVTGMGFEQTLMARVITPLGMGSTSFDDIPLRQGHHRGKPVPPWHLAAMAGAGGLRAPAADLLGFLETVRDGGGVLEEAITETLRPRSDRGRLAVGLGWFLLGDGDVLMHDGGTLGARSEVRLERHSGTAVVVLGDSRRGTERAAGMLLNPH
ncbi:MAG TPA: serine hydrolase domain-containing protein [Candidatus Limnocylindrales bacterium]|nr:serine hydrolase domain-containing protein [Candidatus Limnocylindrales bacterium]